MALIEGRYILFFDILKVYFVRSNCVYQVFSRYVLHFFKFNVNLKVVKVSGSIQIKILNQHHIWHFSVAVIKRWCKGISKLYFPFSANSTAALI